MAALDTNILVRFLVEDDAAQLVAARKLIRKCVQAGEVLHVPVTVALELEWVLRSNFGFAKPEVVKTLSQLLSSVELSFESEAALEVALVLYSQAPADFSDCLHVALAAAAGQQPLWTFDKAASKLAGARLLAAGQLGAGARR
jgi:predicted nucleic-acid-binding protein